MAVGFAVVLARHLADAHAIAQTDFTAFYSGWWLILQGRGSDLYDVSAQQAAQHAIVGHQQFAGGLLAFLHPPHAAIAGVPLGFVAARFGEPVAFWLWAAVNIALLVDLARSLNRLVAPTAPMARAVLVTALLGFFPAFLTIREGQISLLLAVASLRLYLATRAGRDVTAAGWLLAISMKPQLLLIPIVLLAERRRFRTLAWGVVFAGVAMAAAATVLGPRIFVDYLRGLGPLQSHLGSGSPAGMVNLRGLLVRIFGGGHGPIVDGVAFCAWVLATVALGLAWRWRAPHISLEGIFASGFAAALVFSPHLFVPDLVLWVVPLTLAASLLPDGTPASRRFRCFALAWPAAFALTLSIGWWPRLFVETATTLSVAALIWILVDVLRPPALRKSAP